MLSAYSVINWERIIGCSNFNAATEEITVIGLQILVAYRVDTRGIVSEDLKLTLN